jgi:hypothetical protein
VGFCDNAVGFLGGFVTDLGGVSFRALTHGMRAIPGVLEDSLDVLADRIDRWDLVGALGALECGDAPMELS